MVCFYNGEQSVSHKKWKSDEMRYMRVISETKGLVTHMGKKEDIRNPTTAVHLHNFSHHFCHSCGFLAHKVTILVLKFTTYLESLFLV